MDALAPRIAQIGKSIERFQAHKPWAVVILATCVEAYLQDLLADAAGIDTDLMGRSEQRAMYSDVIAAASLDELAAGSRTKWARGWVADGGPAKWIRSLLAMSARGYADDLSARLELVWGIRHVVVHRAGTADADFVGPHRARNPSNPAPGCHPGCGRGGVLAPYGRR